MFFDRYDLLLSPTMPITAAYAEPRDDDLPNPNNYPNWMPYTPAVQPDQETHRPRSLAELSTGFRSGCRLRVSSTMTSRFYRPATATRRLRARFGHPRGWKRGSTRSLAAPIQPWKRSVGKLEDKERA